MRIKHYVDGDYVVDEERIAGLFLFRTFSNICLSVCLKRGNISLRFHKGERFFC